MKKTKKTHKRMMDGGMATMDMPMRGNRPVPAGLMKQEAPVNRPVGADVVKREPPRKLILRPQPFVPGGQNGSGYSSGSGYTSGYSKGPQRPGQAGGITDFVQGPNGELVPISTNSGGGRRNVAGGLGAVGMKKGGAVKAKKMRGGGLARKGVGMALAKGGLAKRAGGCAKRGVGRGKIV